MSLVNASEVKVFLMNDLSFFFFTNRLLPPAARQQQTRTYTHSHAEPVPIHTHPGRLAGEMMVYDVIQ